MLVKNMCVTAKNGGFKISFSRLFLLLESLGRTHYEIIQVLAVLVILTVK